MFSHKVRALAGACRHLKLWPPELLHLNLVRVLHIGCTRDSAEEGETQGSIAQIHRVGEIERRVKAAEYAQFHGILQELVATRIEKLIADRAPTVGQCQAIAALFDSGQANPALYVYLLARTIHLAIVKDIPAVRILQRPALPSSPPPIATPWQNGRPLAVASDQIGYLIARAAR